MTARRWQDWVNLALGVWLFASPFVLQYAGTTAVWNAHVVGAGIVLFAASAAYVPKVWEEVINLLFGVWLVVSPYLLGFAGTTVVALHTVVVGVLVMGFAVWAVFSDDTFYERWHRGHSV